MKNNRVLFLDYVRVLACVLVCLMHAPISTSSSNGFFLAGASLLASPCNGLFFMVSGYLLLPIREETKVFLKKRVTKVLFPTLFWSFFYIFLNIIVGDASWGDFWRTILSIPFSRQGTGWFWFMYVMIGLYMVSPMISKWIEHVSKKEFQFYLTLWAVTCLYPIISNYLEVVSGFENMLYYFCGYIGYFLLGAYLKKYPIKLPIWVVWCIYIFPLLTALVARILDINVLTQQFGNYLSVFVVLMCFSLFCIMERNERYYERKYKLSSIVANISKCSFGIYLIHHFVNHQIINRQYLIEAFGCPLQIIITTVLTVVISYVIIYAFSWLPFAEYIIGYRQKHIKQ